MIIYGLIGLFLWLKLINNLKNEISTTPGWSLEALVVQWISCQYQALVEKGGFKVGWG